MIHQGGSFPLHVECFPPHKPGHQRPSKVKITLNPLSCRRASWTQECKVFSSLNVTAWLHYRGAGVFCSVWINSTRTYIYYIYVSDMCTLKTFFTALKCLDSIANHPAFGSKLSLRWPWRSKYNITDTTTFCVTQHKIQECFPKTQLFRKTQLHYGKGNTLKCSCFL